MVLVSQKSGLEVAVFAVLILWSCRARRPARSCIASCSSGWVSWTCRGKHSLDVAVSDKCCHFYGNPSNLVPVTACCFNPPVPSGHRTEGPGTLGINEISPLKSLKLFVCVK